MIAERAKQISFSTTMQINQKASELKSRGIDVIDLSVLEPDFPTSIHIKNSGIHAIENNFTKYTPATGIPELKQAIRNRISADYKISYEQDEIIVSNGAKHSLFNAFMALVNQGEEVIVPLPIWVSYPEQIKLAQGIPVFIHTDEKDNFLLSGEKLKKAITKKTRAIILCNPCNPTGTVYPEDVLRELSEICMNADIHIIVDEIYDKFIFDNIQFVSIAQLSEEIKKSAIIINGVSKTYSMTGWRIGYAAGPSEIISAMGKIQSHSTSNPCSISQKAAIEALSGNQAGVLIMRDEFQTRRDLVYNQLQNIQDIITIKPQGALNIFPNISGYLKSKNRNMKFENSYDFSKYILENAHVAVVPGSAFGNDRHIRISFSKSMNDLKMGMERINKSLTAL